MIIFLCGGADETKSARYLFLNYLKKFHSDLDISIAEVFTKIQKGKDNLLNLENMLADYSDCIVIFLESSGAVAELGAFCNKENLVKKLLVINEKQHKDSVSFINEGPIKKIQSESEFKEVLYCNMSAPLQIAEYIVSVIETSKLRKRKSIVLKDSELPKKGKLHLLIDLLMILNPISKDDLSKIAQVIKVFEKEKNADQMLDIVEALGYIESYDGYIFPKKYYLEPFLQHKNIVSQKKVRATVLQYYRKNDPKRINIYNSYLRIKDE